MRVFDLAEGAAAAGGEAVLGARDLGTHACYLLYGRLEPGGPPRKLCPGAGHEEIFVVAAGRLALKGEDGETELGPGQAFHLAGKETLWARALEPGTVYAAAGGHSQGAHHDH